MASGTRIQVMGLAAGTTVINSIHLVQTVDPAQWPTLANKVDQDWCRKVNFCQSQNFLWNAVHISWIQAGGPSSQIFALNRPGAGIGLLPMQLAFCIRKNTGGSGGTRRGRWFISGLNPGINALGMPTSQVLAQWPTQLDAIMAAWGAGNPSGWTLGHYSRKDDAVYLVTSLNTVPVFATLGSRRFGVGV